MGVVDRIRDAAVVRLASVPEGKASGVMWRKFLRFVCPAQPAPMVSSRVEDMARAKFPADELGNPSRAQVDYRAQLAKDVRALCALVRYRDPLSPDVDKEAADVLEAHFLSPRERTGA